jgi:PAS domain S-box-containing protein
VHGHESTTNHGSLRVRECTPLDTLSEIFADALDPVFAYTADGRYLYINPAAGAFMELTPLDVVGRHWQELGIPAEVMEPLADKVATVASTGRPLHYRFDATALRDLRVFEVSLSPLWTEARSVLAVLAIFHDVSDYARPKLGS